MKVRKVRRGANGVRIDQTDRQTDRQTERQTDRQTDIVEMQLEK